MRNCLNLTFEIEEKKSIDFEIQETLDIDFELEEITVIQCFPYEGEYVVIPARHDQTLETKHKKMLDDVLVTEIPYTETSNQYGITYIIATD